MTITITISTENTAFENQAGMEVSRILTKLAAQVETWPGVNVFNIGLRDLNGNKVGECVAESNRKRATTPSTAFGLHKLGLQEG